MEKPSLRVPTIAMERRKSQMFISSPKGHVIRPIIYYEKYRTKKRTAIAGKQ